VLIPLEADVESDPTLLFVVDRPLEADVESEVTLLLVEERPVESDPTLL
jgi:hypothetical protein